MCVFEVERWTSALIMLFDALFILNFALDRGAQVLFLVNFFHVFAHLVHIEFLIELFLFIIITIYRASLFKHHVWGVTRHRILVPHKYAFE